MSNGKERQARVARGPVRITMPAKVAFNADMFKRSVAGILEEIGCPTCFSGANCVFENERRFILDPDLNISRMGPHPEPWKAGAAAASTVNVITSNRTKFDVDQVMKAIDRVIEVLPFPVGHQACISGFDVNFRDFLNVITLDENLEAELVGGGF